MVRLILLSHPAILTHIDVSTSAYAHRRVLGVLTVLLGMDE